MKVFDRDARRCRICGDRAASGLAQPVAPFSQREKRILNRLPQSSVDRIRKRA
jgi:hypothetical protein